MTCIAFKDGILAADTGIWSGDTMIGECQKIIRLPDGCLVAAAGVRSECQRFAQWARNTTRDRCIKKVVADWPEHWAGFDVDDEDFGVLIVEMNGTVIRIDGRGIPHTIESDVAIEGCAGEMAFYAMLAGASAAEAVALCIAHHSHAGGKVQVEFLEAA